MEPEAVAFLKRVALSVFFAFMWLAVNVTIGLKFDLAFAAQKITIGNIIYYTWLVASFIFLLLFYIRLWRNALRF